MDTLREAVTRRCGGPLRTSALKALLAVLVVIWVGSLPVSAQGAHADLTHWIATSSLGVDAEEADVVSREAARLYSLSDYSTPALTRTISLRADDLSVEEALNHVAAKAGLKLSYGSGTVAVEKKVTLDYEGATVRRVLQDVVHETDLTLLLSRSGHVVVKENYTAPAPETKTLPAHARLAPMGLNALRELPVRRQAGIITGTVTDAETGESLPGANVVIDGTQQGAMTDVDGWYEIAGIDAGTYTLRASFIGYQQMVVENVEVPDGETVTVDFALVPSTEELDELVVVGYGELRRRDLTGSVASVSAAELQESVNTTLDQALQGRVAGVTVTQNSGQPGGGVSVNIRGVSSLGGDAEPLYVIDGVPISGSAESTTSSTGVAQTTTNALATLNPQDIESIEILKDASATAIYGSRAANGVVLITTRRGQAGTTEVTYDGYYGVQQLPQRVGTMNLREFAQFQNERAEALGLTPSAEFADPSLLGEGTDWQEVLFRDAPMQNHNVRLSGGTDDTRYMLSGSFFDQEGIATASWFKRYSMRLNLENQSLDWLKVGTNLNMARTRERINVTNENIINLAVRQRPDVPVRAPDGSWGGPSDPQFTLDNPVGRAELLENYRQRSQVLGNVFGEIQFTDNLSLRNEFNGNVEYTEDEQFTPTYEFGARTNEVNSSYRASGNSFFWMVKNYLTYRNTHAGLGVTAMVGHEAQESNWEGISAGRDNFPTNNVQELAVGDPATDTNNSYAGSSALQSFFGRLNLSYDDRYLLTTTLRADGSSKFGPENKWGYFPSFSLAWVPSEEPFLSGPMNAASIDNFKIRFGYGQVGNQNIGNYTYGAALNTWATAWGAGFLPANIPNPFVQWETTDSYNLGTDLSLINHRVKLSADAYIKNTRDLLLTVPLPPHAGTSGQGGFEAPTVNIGAIENRGIELSLNTVNLNSDLVWNSDFVFSTNENTVTEMNNDESVIDRSINFTDVVSRTVVGEPVGQFYGYIVEGVFEDAEDIQSSARPADLPVEPNGIWVGDYKFRDLNDDGVIDENDRTFIGNPMPDFTFGVGNNFYYKNFQLSFFINGSYGNEIFNDIRRENENPNGNFGLLDAVDDYARIEVVEGGDPNNVEDVYVSNPETMVPRLTTSDANVNYRVSDRFIEDGSYIRLKNLTLGYNLAPTAVNYFDFRTMRVYLKIENVYTITGYSGYDPEVGSYLQDPLLSGVDDGRYPAARTYTVGVSLGM